MKYPTTTIAVVALLAILPGKVAHARTGQDGDAIAVKTQGWISPDVMNAAPAASISKADTLTPDGAGAAVLSSDTTISGIDTLGKPKSGYLWSPKMAQFSMRYVNESGWNQSVSSNDGRTGVAASRISVEQNGNGDAGAYYAMCQIGGKGRVGASHWLAQPACVLLNGDVATTVPHSYLNVQEFSLSDNGRDVAGIGTVYRFQRTENAASQGEVWFGVRNQSLGSKAIDAGVSNAGPMNIGVDTVMARADPQFDGGAVVALNMAADQKVVYNSRSRAMNGIEWYGNHIGTAYDGYSSRLDALVRCNGAACLQVEAQSVSLANAGLKLSVIRTIDLPACSRAAEGTLYAVTDARDETFNAGLVGGGNGHVMAYCNGTRWTVH